MPLIVKNISLVSKETPQPAKVVNKFHSTLEEVRRKAAKEEKARELARLRAEALERSEKKSETVREKPEKKASSAYLLDMVTIDEL